MPICFYALAFEHVLEYEGIIQFDINRIRRVLLNLATNAKDAMVVDASGKNRFRLEIKTNSKGLVILVIDNGPGIKACLDNNCNGN